MASLLEAAGELTDCARYGEAEEVKQLLAAAAPAAAELANTAAAPSGNAALHMAAANGHAGICELLLLAGATVDAKNGVGNTPLHWAALNGHLATVNLLLAHDASPFEMNAEMRIALDEATAGDHADVVTAIRLHGEGKVKANQAKREQERADTVQASTGSSAAEAAAEASESAAEAANLVEMDTVDATTAAAPPTAAAAAAAEPEPMATDEADGGAAR